jgi:hypothetical protein
LRPFDEFITKLLQNLLVITLSHFIDSCDNHDIHRIWLISREDIEPMKKLVQIRRIFRHFSSKAEMQFQLISDVHVEMMNTFEKLTDFPTLAPYLVLAGDIGNPFSKNYHGYLSMMSASYKKVFVLLGNHEFYKNEYYSTITKAKEVCDSLDNVIFMNRTCIQIEDVVILGCTLWSKVPENCKEAVWNGLNDYD